MKLHRIKGAEEPRYIHPHGFRIIRKQRDWSLRGFPRGALGGTERTAPKTWWEVTSIGRRARGAPVLHSELTLREARAWCDRHELVVGDLREVA